MTIQKIKSGRGHWYRVDGRKADGVTTLIKDGLPKPALMYWSAKAVAEHVADNLDAVTGMREMGRDSIINALKGVPWAQRDAAAVKGTEVHVLAEKLTHGEAVEVPDEYAGYVESCIKFLDEWRVRPVLTETTVANRRWNYAGTFDTVVDTIKGRAMIDWKTGRSGIFPDAALQQAAYCNAEVYLDGGGTEHPMSELAITAAYGVWLRQDGYDVYNLDISEATFKVFQHVAFVARRAREKDSWMSESLPVPALTLVDGAA